MTIRVALPTDVTDIVRVHQSAFPSYFLTQMGPGFLRAYYNLVLNYDRSVCLVAEERGSIVGFVVGAVDPARFCHAMSASKRRMLFPILMGIARRPWLVGRVLDNSRRVNQAETPPYVPSDQTCELTSIGVQVEATGQGIGRQMIAGFIEEAKQYQVLNITLTTDAHENDAVNRFYEKQGFTLLRQIPRSKMRLMNEFVLDVENLLASSPASRQG